jgi:hypothetical protein
MVTDGPLQEAVDLNNKAALHVKLGRFSEATSVLERATDLLWTSAFSPKRIGRQSTVVLSNDDATDCNNTPNDPGAQATDNQEGMMYIYDRLLLPPSDLRGILQADRKFTLFNLALSHHLQGRATGDTECLARARALYRRILWECKSRTQGALFKCLVLNGLADLHHRVG